MNKPITEKTISLSRINWEYDAATYIASRLCCINAQTFRDHHRIYIHITNEASLLIKFQKCVSELPTLYVVFGTCVSNTATITKPSMIIDVAPVRLGDNMTIVMNDAIIEWLLHGIRTYTGILLEDHFSTELRIEDNFNSAAQVFNDIIDRKNPHDTAANSSEWFTIIAHHMRGGIPTRAIIKADMHIEPGDPEYDCHLINEMRLEIINDILGYNTAAFVELRKVSLETGKLAPYQRMVCTSVDELKHTCVDYLNTIQDLHSKVQGSKDIEQIYFYINQEE